MLGDTANATSPGKIRQWVSFWRAFLIRASSEVRSLIQLDLLSSRALEAGVPSGDRLIASKNRISSIKGEYLRNGKVCLNLFDRGIFLQGLTITEQSAFEAINHTAAGLRAMACASSYRMQCGVSFTQTSCRHRNTQAAPPVCHWVWLARQLVDLPSNESANERLTPALE